MPRISHKQNQSFIASSPLEPVKDKSFFQFLKKIANTLLKALGLQSSSQTKPLRAKITPPPGPRKQQKRAMGAIRRGYLHPSSKNQRSVIKPSHPRPERSLSPSSKRIRTKLAITPLQVREFDNCTEHVVAGNGSCLYASLLLGLQRQGIQGSENIESTDDMRTIVFNYFRDHKRTDDGALFELAFNETYERMVAQGNQARYEEMEHWISARPDESLRNWLRENIPRDLKAFVLLNQIEAIKSTQAFGGNVALYALAQHFQVNIQAWTAPTHQVKDPKTNQIFTVRDEKQAPIATNSDIATQIGISFPGRPTIYLVHETQHYNYLEPKI